MWQFIGRYAQIIPNIFTYTLLQRGKGMAAAGGAYTGLSPSSYGQLYSQQQPGYAASQGV